MKLSDIVAALGFDRTLSVAAIADVEVSVFALFSVLQDGVTALLAKDTKEEGAARTKRGEQ